MVILNLHHQKLPEFYEQIQHDFQLFPQLFFGSQKVFLFHLHNAVPDQALTVQVDAALQILLGFEVQIQAAFGHAAVFRDFLHGGGRNPLCGKQLQGGFQNLFFLVRQFLRQMHLHPFLTLRFSN